MPWVVVPLPYTEHCGVPIYHTRNEAEGGWHRYRFSTSIDAKDERYHFDVRELPLESVRRLTELDWRWADWIEDRVILDVVHEAIDRGLLRKNDVPRRGRPH